MHDAVQAFERRYEPYCMAIAGASGSPVAAAAKAARDVLAALFPSAAQLTQIDAAYATLTAGYIASGLMTAGDPGTAVGEQAAACMIQRRVVGDDGDLARHASVDTWKGRTGPGEWRPTVFTTQVPPQPVAMAGEYLARTPPFGMKEIDQFRVANAAPHLTSGAYAKAYNEVKQKGASDARERTAEETAIARFYSDAPANYWNRLLRDLVLSESLSLGDSARMFALVSMATADAIISCWDTKIHYNVWRPVTAIREGDNDGNVETVGEAGWTSLFNAPNYPDYTSGANNVAAASATTLAHLFGNHFEFTLFSNAREAVSPNPPAPPPLVAPRTYTKFSDAERDVVDARVFMGIHFRFADTAARRQGTHIANWTVSHFLRPIGGSGR